MKRKPVRCKNVVYVHIYVQFHLIGSIFFMFFIIKKNENSPFFVRKTVKRTVEIK